MSGYCRDCGNTLCICADIAAQTPTPAERCPKCDICAQIGAPCPLHEPAPESPAPNAFDDNRNPITLSVSNGEPQAPAQGERTTNSDTNYKAISSSEVREIALTQGMVTLVDAEDFEWLNQWKWFASGKKGQGYFYAMRAATPEERKAGFGTAIRMHRLIANPNKNQMVDHANGNTLDNRKQNLRVCSRNQNAMNVQAQRTAKVKYKGVNFCEADQVFHAKISIDGTVRYIGSYKTAMEAALAYDKFAMHIQGEFARLNFPSAASCETVEKLRAELAEAKRDKDTLIDIQIRVGKERDAARAEVERYRHIVDEEQAHSNRLKAALDEMSFILARRVHAIERARKLLDEAKGKRE